MEGNTAATANVVSLLALIGSMIAAWFAYQQAEAAARQAKATEVGGRLERLKWLSGQHEVLTRLHGVAADAGERVQGLAARLREGQTAAAAELKAVDDLGAKFEDGVAALSTEVRSAIDADHVRARLAGLGGRIKKSVAASAADDVRHAAAELAEEAAAAAHAAHIRIQGVLARVGTQVRETEDAVLGRPPVPEAIIPWWSRIPEVPESKRA